MSKLAEDLENAGKNRDTGFINGNTEKLLLMYRGLDEKLSAVDKKEENLSKISAEEMKEAYQTIYEIASAMDYEMMDGILKDLRGYSLSEEDAKRISGIEEMLTRLDWDGITKTAVAML